MGINLVIAVTDGDMTRTVLIWQFGPSNCRVGSGWTDEGTPRNRPAVPHLMRCRAHRRSTTAACGLDHATSDAALVGHYVFGRSQNMQGKQRYEQVPGDIMPLFHEIVEILT